MLNLQFYYIFVFFLPILLLKNTICVIILNYLFHVKSFLKIKLKKQNKTESGVYSLNAFVVLSLLMFINFLLFFNRFSFYLLPNDCNCVLNKYAYTFFLFFSFLSYIINYVYKYYYNYEYKINFNNFISLLFTSIVYFTLYSNNFLTLFVYLELLSYLFYLQFLQIFDKFKTKNIKNSYLDSLLLYYWLNYLSSVILFYSIILIYYKYNTSNFLELTYFNNIKLFFFFLGFSLKLSAPGFHFLKVEIYKNFRIDSIINFSFLSLLGYSVLLKFIFISLNLTININYLVIFLTTSLVFLLFSNFLKINNLVLFFGYSTVLNTALCLFFIF